MRFAQALLLIPPGAHLRCGCEQNPETGEVFGSAGIYAEPPEDGWPEPRHPTDKFEDQAIVAISTDEVDFEAFELLTVLMIVDRYGTDRQKTEARKKLDQRALHTPPLPIASQHASSASNVKAGW